MPDQRHAQNNLEGRESRRSPGSGPRPEQEGHAKGSVVLRGRALPSEAMAVWCVWTEWGEYEQWSRDLRGAFATREIAEAHAEQLRASREYDVCEVIEEEVLDAVPSSVPYIEWSAHIFPDGREDRERGYDRGEKFKTWSNEISPARGEIREWNPRRGPDLYIEVIGCDPAAVEAEYKRLLAEARERLAGAA